MVNSKMIFEQTTTTTVLGNENKKLYSFELDDESDYYSDSDWNDESSSSFSDGEDSVDLSELTELKNELVNDSITKEDKRSGLFLSLDMVKALRVSTSDGKVNALMQHESIQKMIPKSSSVNAVQGQMILAIQTKSSTGEYVSNSKNESIETPTQLLKSVLASNDLSWEAIREKAIMNKSFVKGSENGYTSELMGAVKKGDIQKLRRIHETHPTMNFQLSNRFGESIVHAAARHGHHPILQFVVEECHVSLFVKCDGGRNPLHDSVWTGKPNFSCIEYIIQTNPELLLLSDNRGFLPFDYIPRDIYGEWNHFIRENESKLIALLHSSYYGVSH